MMSTIAWITIVVNFVCIFMNASSYFNNKRLGAELKEVERRFLNMSDEERAAGVDRAYWARRLR